MKIESRLCILVLLLGLIVIEPCGCTKEDATDDRRVFNLTSGRFKASKVRVINRIVDRLIGVPYGETPQLFEKPTQYRRKTENLTREINDWPPMCIQPVIFHNSFYGNFKLPHDYDMSFGCLTMNIYIPRGIPDDEKPSSSRKQELKSAMFFIHGGSNAAGAASFMDGSALAAAGQVIVAMPNYRLDVIGFLNLYNSSSARGNYGLWDQLLALKWLHTNCPSLGCDPKSITVFGHSAGSSDTMLLAMSPLAQPYIKRIIMQSGSGLAHWSFLYETHLMKKIQKSPQLLEFIGFRESKYVASLHDTYENFLIHTTCNLTTKYDCIRSRLVNFIRFTSNMVPNHADPEQKFIDFIDALIDRLDIDEFMNLFGTIYKQLKEAMGTKLFDKIASNVSHDKWFLLYKNKGNESNSSHRASARIAALISRTNLEKRSNDTETTPTPYTRHAESSANKSSNSSCLSDVAFLLRDNRGLKQSCDFFKQFVPDKWPKLLTSQVMNYFMNCFKLYTSEVSEKPDYSLPFNGELLVSEMRTCFNYAPRTTNSVREASLLTENSNYLHRPTIDGDLIRQIPQDELRSSEFINGNIDVLVGLTSHESFYFLLHDYNINDILLHSLIYSSILNYTDNIMDKLNDLIHSRELGNCLKRNLFGYYNMTMTDQELLANSLKNKIQSIELISDYDFVLPMITQLKFYSNFTTQRDKPANKSSKLFAYEYSHITSFNYLLDHLKSFHMGYDQALVQLNNSVVPHFSELDFVFGLPLLSMSGLIKSKSRPKYLYNYTKEEVEFSLLVIDYWTNFAKYGDPNFNGSEDEFVKVDKPKWKQFEAHHPNIFKLTTKKQDSKPNIYNQWLEKHDFWYNKLPNEVYNECKSGIGGLAKTHGSTTNSANALIFNSFIFVSTLGGLVLLVK